MQAMKTCYRIENRSINSISYIIGSVGILIILAIYEGTTSYHSVGKATKNKTKPSADILKNKRAIKPCFLNDKREKFFPLIFIINTNSVVNSTIFLFNNKIFSLVIAKGIIWSIKSSLLCSKYFFFYFS